jgi:phosphatidylglycerophosphate synthase
MMLVKLVAVFTAPWFLYAGWLFLWAHFTDWLSGEHAL